MSLPAPRTTAGATPRETVATSAEYGHGLGLLRALALSLALIQRSAWKGYSPKVAIRNSHLVLQPSLPRGI
jgi:hypothetical protein